MKPELIGNTLTQTHHHKDERTKLDTVTVNIVAEMIRFVCAYFNAAKQSKASAFCSWDEDSETVRRKLLILFLVEWAS